MLESILPMVLNSQAGKAAAGAMFSSAPSQTLSGGPFDGRATMGNAGWTVATGQGRAEGARLTGEPLQAAYGLSPALSGQAATAGGMLQAGGGTMVLLMAGLVLAVVLARKRKG